VSEMTRKTWSIGTMVAPIGNMMDPIPYRTLDPSFQGDLVDRVQERLLNGSKIAGHGRRE